MFGIRFMKAPPTTYVLHYKSGRVVREGAGLSFFYYAPTSSLVAVPVASTDLPFVFNEAAADYQAVTVQGQLTYRVADAKRLASLLNFSIRPDGAYVSDDPETLGQRLINATQVLARAAVQRMALRDALVIPESAVGEILAALRRAEAVGMLGVEILGLSILSVKPTPEMAKALEAEAREALQRRADEAIYARRNAAVEQERRIKENELSTEIAVEEKKRQIREAQMNAEIAVEEKKRQVRETQIGADIAVEERRTALVQRRVENNRKMADSRSYELEAMLKPIRGMDWKTLLAASAAGSDPALQIALAFREMSENAQKIGTLNVTPDLMQAVLSAGAKKA